MGVRRTTALLLLAISIPSLLASASLEAIVSGFAISGASANLLCTSPPCSQAITGWLHTNPNSDNVYDGNGNLVRLQGVNVDGLDFGTGGSSLSPDSCGKGWKIAPTSFANVASWGFNFVRIPISRRTLNLQRLL